jgi:hypothetical protein
MASPQQSKVKTYFLAFLVIATIFLTVFGLWYWSWQWIDQNVFSSLTTESNESARGTFGDKFGAINSLFSGFAFAGIIVTLLLQRQDLARQQTQIEQTNEEMKKQGATLRRQRFESTFFHMLELHSDIVGKLSIDYNTQREAFGLFLDLIKTHTPQLRVFHALRKFSHDEIHELKIKKSIPINVLNRLDEEEKRALNDDITNDLISTSKSGEPDLSFHERLINSAYILAHRQSKDALSHYFRNLYNILRFIDETSDVPDDDKEIYTRIVRAQLSDQELVTLFYNCTVICNDNMRLELGYPKMTRLVKKYDLIQNINEESLMHSTHILIFEKRAIEASKA